MAVLATLKDGRVIASGSATYTVPIGGGNQPVAVTISELRKVEYVMQYKFTTDPLVDPGTPVNEKIVDNAVGCTIAGVAAGTTLTVEVIALGF